MAENLRQLHEETDFWVFDLDNTLYPPECNLFAQVDLRMGEFIASHLDMEPDAARKLQKSYFREYGTTLRGLMLNHDLSPQEFLDFVHNIDFSSVPEIPLLNHALFHLPGRKYVFTNGSENYACTILKALGIEAHFSGIFDIHKAGYTPKPAPETYDSMLAQFDINPHRAVMIEDIARNLQPAAERGMKTVWVPMDTDWSHAGAEGMSFDYIVEDLPAWLWKIVTANPGHISGNR